MAPCERFPEMYNIEWKTQSPNSSASMPIGGCGIGLNVWVENGELLFYIAKSDTFDECNHILKLGRIRLTWEPNPLLGADVFSQELKLGRGCIEICAGHEQHGSLKARIWVEVDRPVIHVEAESSRELKLDACYESWRTHDRELPLDERQTRFHGFGYGGFPGRVVRRRDRVQFRDAGVEWFHRNRGRTVFDDEVEEQELEDIKGKLWDPLSGRVFGGLMRGDELGPAGITEGRYVSTLFRGWHLESKIPSTGHELDIYLSTRKAESTEEWREGLHELREKEPAKDERWSRHQEWWSGFWERSWVVINPGEDAKDPAWQIGRNYQLFRFMLGCTGLGRYPIKFNGGFFTFDPQFHKTRWKWLSNSGESPDYRAWGGGSYTAQNQRLVYWPMLKNGDFDLMEAQLEFYNRGLKNATLRTRHYWGHEGCSFTEQMNQYALPIGATYGWKDSYLEHRNRTEDLETGVQVSRAVGRLYASQLEFAWMMLLYAAYSSRELSPYLDCIEAAVRFYDQHYRYRQDKREGRELDADGNLVIWPSNALEAHPDAKNPTSVIAGLRRILRVLLALPAKLQPEEKKEEWREMLGRLPEMPTGIKEGRRYLKPAENWEHNSNHSPEMYPLFPYRLHEIDEVSLELMRNTWELGLDADARNSVTAWVQGGIHAALLGLKSHTKSWLMDKLSEASPHARFRFPAFWDTFDYPPDHNYGGTGMIAVQEMLMQTAGEKIRLLSCWPEDWDVDFRLHAPCQTTVECSVREGKVVKLDVEPSNRRKDVLINSDFCLTGHK